MAHYPYNNLRIECTLSDARTYLEEGEDFNDNRYTAEGVVFTPAVPLATWEGTKESMLQGMTAPNPTNLRYADIINHIYSPERNNVYYWNNQVIQYSTSRSPIQLVYMLRLNHFSLSNCSVGALHPEGVIFVCNNNTENPHAILVYEIEGDPYAEYRLIRNYPRIGNTLQFGHFHDNKFYMSDKKIYDIEFNEVGEHRIDSVTVSREDDMLGVQQTNRWHIGTAVRQSGTRSCYISNNSLNLTFSATASTSHFYHDVELLSTATNRATISFNWLSGNSSVSWNFLDVHITQTSFFPSEGTLFDTNNPLVLGRLFRNTQNLSNGSWQHTGNINIPVLPIRTYRIVFTWRNSSGSGTPAAVDNIVIRTNIGPNIVENFETGSGINLFKWTFFNNISRALNLNFGFGTERDSMYGYNGNMLNPHSGDGKFVCFNRYSNNPNNVFMAIYDVITDEIKELSPSFNVLGGRLRHISYYMANNCVVAMAFLSNNVILRIYDLETDTLQEHNLGRHTADIPIWYVKPTRCRRYVSIASGQDPFNGNLHQSVSAGFQNFYSFFAFVDTLEKKLITRNTSISGDRNRHFMHTAFAFIEYNGEFISAQTKMVDENALHRICDVPVIVGDTVYTYGTVGDNAITPDSPLFPVYFGERNDRLQLLETIQSSYMHLSPNANAPNTFTTNDLGYRQNFAPTNMNINYVLNYNGDIYRLTFSNANWSTHLVVSHYNITTYAWDVIVNRDILNNPNLLTTTTVSATARPLHLYYDENFIIFLVHMSGYRNYYFSSTDRDVVYRLFKFNKTTFDRISEEHSTLLAYDSANITNPDYFSNTNTNSYLSYGRFLVYLNNNILDNGILTLWIYDVTTNTNRRINPTGWTTLMTGMGSTVLTQFSVTQVQVNDEKLLISLFRSTNSFCLLIEYNLLTLTATVLNTGDEPVIESNGMVYRILNNIYIGSGGNFDIYNTNYEKIDSISGMSDIATHSDYYKDKYDNAVPNYPVLSDNKILVDSNVVVITDLDEGYIINSHFYLDGMSCVLGSRTGYNHRLYRLNEDFSTTFLHECSEITTIRPTNNTANISTQVLYNAHLPAIMPFKRIPSNVSSMSYILPMKNNEEFFLVSNARGGVMKLTAPKLFTLTNAPIDEVNYNRCGIGTQTKLLYGTVEPANTVARWRTWDAGDHGITEIGGNMTQPTLITNNFCNDRIYAFHSGNIYKFIPETSRVDLFQDISGTTNVTQYGQHPEHREGRFYFVRGNELWRESDDLRSAVRVLTSPGTGTDANIVKVIPVPGTLLYYANARSVFSFDTATGIQTTMGTTTNANNNIMDIAVDNNYVVWGVTGSVNNNNRCTVFDFVNGSMFEHNARCLGAGTGVNANPFDANTGTTTVITDITRLCRIIFEPEYNRHFLFTSTYQAYYWSDVYGHYIHRSGNAITNIGMLDHIATNWNFNIFLFQNLIFACGSTAVVVWEISEYENLVASELDWQLGRDKRHFKSYSLSTYGCPHKPALAKNMNTSDITDVLHDQYIPIERRLMDTYPNNLSRGWNRTIQFGRREVSKFYEDLPLNTLIVVNKLPEDDKDSKIYLEILGSPGVAYIHWGMPIHGDRPTDVRATEHFVYPLSTLDRELHGLPRVTKVNLTGDTEVELVYHTRNVHCIGIYTNCSITTINCFEAHIMQFDVSNNKDIKYINISCNLMFENELNNTFRSLPIVDNGIIRIGVNPHKDRCDDEIATKKGWTVYRGHFIGFTGTIRLRGRWTATPGNECYPFDQTTTEETARLRLRHDFSENSVVQAIGTMRFYDTGATIETSGPVTIIEKSEEIPYGGVKVSFGSGDNVVVMELLYGDERARSMNTLCFLGNNVIVGDVDITMSGLKIE